MKYILQNPKSNYDKEINSIINARKSKIFAFFQVKEIELPFTIYVYDSIENLAQGLKERGFGNHPSYMCACHKEKDNSLNFFEPKANPSASEWSKEEYQKVIFHELVHGIQFTLFGYAPEWLNEGIAKFLDGTYKKGIKWLLENYINDKPIPKQIEIEREFGWHDYDSYDYAYLMVSYLIETLGQTRFISFLKNPKQFELLMESFKDSLLNKAIIYYNKKYKIERIK